MSRSAAAALSRRISRLALIAGREPLEVPEPPIGSPPWIAFSTHLEIKGLRGISFARSVTGIIVVIGRGVWVCPKELCARAERGSQDRQNKYSHHLGHYYVFMVFELHSFQNCSDGGG